MEDCPKEVKRRHPCALLKYALHLFIHNERELFGEVCKEFITNIEMDESLNDELRNQLFGEFELLISFTAYNDIKKMTAHHRKAWELLKQPASITTNKANWTFGSPSVLYMFYRESGKLEDTLMI